MPTSLKLPADIKRRIAAVARKAKTTPHAFMVDAIKQEIDRSEKRQEFVRSALVAREEFHRERTGYDMAEVHDFILRRSQGKPARRPKARRWPR